MAMNGRVEVPQAPRGLGSGDGVSHPHWGKGLGVGCDPSPENFCGVRDHIIFG